MWVFVGISIGLKIFFEDMRYEGYLFLDYLGNIMGEVSRLVIIIFCGYSLGGVFLVIFVLLLMY